MFCSKLERVNPSRNGIDAIRPAHDDKITSLSARVEIKRGPRTASPVANCSETNWCTAAPQPSFKSKL